MPKLDLKNAVGIRVGAGEVLKLKGLGFTWERPQVPAPTGLVLNGPASANAVLLNGNKSLTRSGGGNYAHAWCADPLTGKLYIEVQIDAAATGGDPVVNLAGDDTTFIDENDVAALEWNTPRAYISAVEWDAYIRANYGMGTNEVGQSFEVFSDLYTDIRVCIAIDTTTRRVWVATNRGSSGGVLPGDPAAGTGFLAQLNGSGAIRFGLSAAATDVVTIVSPDQHMHNPPAGFTRA